MQFAPLAGATATRMLARFPALAAIDSLVLVTSDRALVRSSAVLAVLRYLGGPWRVLTVFRIVPREIRDSAYDVVAFWRNRLFGRYTSCPVPPARHRHRFLP